eukprot:7441682-Alexandrium_andersonii.AAC.1
MCIRDSVSTACFFTSSGPSWKRLCTRAGSRAGPREGICIRASAQQSLMRTGRAPAQTPSECPARAAPGNASVFTKSVSYTHLRAHETSAHL